MGQCWLSLQTLAVMYLEDTFKTFVLTFSVCIWYNTHLVMPICKNCLWLLAFLILESPNTTTLAPALSDSPDGSQQIIAIIGVTLGVVGTTVVAVTACCIWSRHRRRYATQVTQLCYPELRTFLNSIEHIQLQCLVFAFSRCVLLWGHA